MAEQISYSKETLASMQTKLIASIRQADESIEQEFRELQEFMYMDTINLTADAVTKFVVLSEWRVARLRMKVTSELSTCQKMLNYKPTEGMQRTIKERISQLLTYCQRLNELRDDFTVIQKMVYTQGFSKL